MGTVLSLFGVEPIRIGGAEAFARELSRQLGAAGWQSVLCFGARPAENVRTFLALSNVTLETLPVPERVSLAGLTTFVQLLRRHRPKVVHLHFTGFVSPYPWLAKLALARRVCYSDQTSQPEGRVPRRASAVQRVLTRAINWPLTIVTTPSEYGRRFLTTRDVFPSCRIEVLFNAVDLDRVPTGQDTAAAFRQRYGIPTSRLLVVQVSWLIPEKGLDDLLDAARLVVDRRSSVHFAIIGDGADGERYRLRTRELRLRDHVTFTGLVQDPLLQGVYAAADVVCQASRWEEIFGWTIAEAMASGKPVVATRVGGIPEVVEDGQTGRLVPPRDPQALADAIIHLLDDADARAALGTAGRARAERRFDLRHTVSRLLGVYGIATRSEASKRPGLGQRDDGQRRPDGLSRVRFDPRRERGSAGECGRGT